MFRNPLFRRFALFLVVKAVLVGAGLWWFAPSPSSPSPSQRRGTAGDGPPIGVHAVDDRPAGDRPAGGR